MTYRRLAILGVLAAAGALTGCGETASPQPTATQAPLPPERPVPTTATPQSQTDLSQDERAESPDDIDSAETAPSRVFSAADRRSFEALEQRLGGKVGVAVAPVGIGAEAERLGSLSDGVAWSTAKVPVAMAVIDAGLADQYASDLRQAITASDNAAAERLWDALGGGAQAAGAADDALRSAGDDRTEIQSQRLRPGFTPFGQTAWRLTDQARFTGGMQCTSSGRQVLGLMGDVVPGQRWGLGSAGAPARFKGGWGPGSQPGRAGSYFTRQMGVLQIDGQPLAVAIAALPSDGSEASGQRALTELAKWVTSHASPRAGAPGSGSTC